MGFDYVSKQAKIYVTTLTVAGTWYQVLTEDNAVGIRGYKIKSRMKFNSNGAPAHPQRPFKYAFNNAPDETDGVTNGKGYWSVFTGAGENNANQNGIWASSDVNGTIIELMTFL